ncbi:MAG: S8 family serine peptidase [Candidatus Zixiibacteriota bacterium]
MRIKGSNLWRRLVVMTVLLCVAVSTGAASGLAPGSNFVRDKAERLKSWRSSVPPAIPQSALNLLRLSDEIGMIVLPAATRLPLEMSKVWFRPNINPVAPESYVLANIVDSAVVSGQVVAPVDSGLLAEAVIDSVMLVQFFSLDIVWLGKTWADATPDDTFTVFTEEGVFFRDLSRHYHIGFSGTATPEDAIESLLGVNGVQEAFQIGIPASSSEEPEPEHEPRCQYRNDSTVNQYYLFPYDSGGVNAFGAWDLVCEGISDNKEVVIGIDDDGFGTNPAYHPDIRYNISPKSSAAFNSTYNHGTAVAGVCGATASETAVPALGKISTVPDGRGIVGVSPRTKMVLRDHGHTRYVSDLKYLIDSCDVDILNFSWGLWPFDNRDLHILLERAFYQKEIALIAGAGNCGLGVDCPRVVYPAAYPFVLAVSGSARDPYDHHPIRAGENWGAWLDMVAPSVDVLSTGGYAKFPSDTIPANYGYSRRNGTSMSAAITSGVAALMKTANPALSAATLYDILTQTAKPLEGYDPGWNAATGWGIADAREAALRVINRAHCDSLPGDANGDCYVNWADALQVIRFLHFGVPLPEPNNADVNADCQVDISDLQALIDYAVYGAGILLYGCVESEGRVEQSKTPSSTPVLNAAFPNPFNPSTEIGFELPTASHVRLEVFNVLGQHVATLVDGPMESGRHSVAWDGSNAASGIYLYRFQTGSFVMSRKMLLVK